MFIYSNVGIKSSGKASYFLALFPYIIMGVLLVRAVTLPGSVNGILYFLTPQWNELLNPRVKMLQYLVRYNKKYQFYFDRFGFQL